MYECNFRSSLNTLHEVKHFLNNKQVRSDNNPVAINCIHLVAINCIHLDAISFSLHNFIMVEKIDIHNHILPKEWPDLKKVRFVHNL